MFKLNPLTAIFAAVFLCASLAVPAPSFAARSVNSLDSFVETAATDESDESSDAAEEPEAEAPRAISPRDAARPKSPSVRAPSPPPEPVASKESTATPAPAPAPAPVSGSTHNDYVLGAGDKLRITVFGEADLSGPFEVSSTGMVSMPLIGQVRAAGNTVSRLEALITEKLKDGYMKDPRVGVEVQGYRPFFIVGEVMKPGRYDYVNGMTVITAVALAGGYTYRADKDGITLKHAGASAREAPVKEDAAVVPGDVIRVPERFF
jgi:protein involved in polysaccharide export with SLBB domain